MVDHPNQEIQVIELLQELGEIANSNIHYTAGITRRLNETGKSILDLTVREISEINQEYNRFYNEVYRG